MGKYSGGSRSTCGSVGVVDLHTQASSASNLIDSLHTCLSYCVLCNASARRLWVVFILFAGWLVFCCQSLNGRDQAGSDESCSSVDM